VDVEQIRRKHWREGQTDVLNGSCHWCDGDWPCHTATVLAALATAQQELETTTNSWQLALGLLEGTERALATAQQELANCVQVRDLAIERLKAGGLEAENEAMRAVVAAAGRVKQAQDQRTRFNWELPGNTARALSELFGTLAALDQHHPAVEALLRKVKDHALNHSNELMEVAEGLRAALTQAQRWQPIETAPQDTAVLVYGVMYDVAHFNTALGAWVSCWDHRPMSKLKWWQPLPPQPER
jgi:hypothetical protein